MLINFIFALALESFDIKNDRSSNAETIIDVKLKVLEDISGSFGDNMNYNIQSETLTISGQSSIGPCNDLESCPYKQYNESIKSIAESQSINIGDSSFSCCSNLQSISIPTNTFFIGSGAFNECSSLQSITIPEKINTLSADLFNGCNNLQSIEILGNIATIGSNSFKNCFQLTTVEIPTNSQNIAISANTFENCINMISLKISGNVNSIGSYAFKNCSSLKRLNFSNIAAYDS